MKKYLILFLTIALFGCQRTLVFKVDGVVSNANDEILYLEHTGLVKTNVVDSCVLGADGAFELKAPVPEYPDFYRLRLGSQSLLLAVDSTETITIKTKRDSLAYTTTIKGSENSLIISKLRAIARNASRDNLREEAKKIIVSNPGSLAAYYAVFLKQEGQYIWNIMDHADRRMYQAVATSFNMWMPEYERTKALYNQVLEVIEAERSFKNQTAMRQFIAESENSILDITLPNEVGEMQSLSDLQGKVVILDFSSSEMDHSVGYNFELRELYNKYHQRGLDIYSVSVDRNKLLWEQTVEHLPWVTVYADPNMAASVLIQYNVQGLPTLFLLDRKGNVQGRYVDFKQLDADIRKYL
jgi:peroxiredoxin